MSVSKTVLVHEWVTGGGLAGAALPASWAAEGSAMRRAIAADFAGVPGVRVVMTLDARLGPEPGPWTVVPAGPGFEPELLARIAGDADYTVLVAPETGGVLADRTRLLERAGARLLGSTVEAVELAGDKLALAARLRACGVVTPESVRVNPAAGLPRAFLYPAVLKPIDGAGAVDTFLIDEPDALPPEAMGMTDALLQPWVPGTAMSASVLVGPAGRVEIVAAGRQRMNRIGPRFVYSGGTMPVPIGIAGPAVLRAIDSVAGLRGFVGVDFLLDHERQTATIVEINPRPTTSLVGLARLLPSGRLARAWIAAAHGTMESFDPPGELARFVNSRGLLTFEADGAVHDHPASVGVHA